MSDDNTPPPPQAAAAAAAASSSSNQDDTQLAASLQTMEALTTVFGFDPTWARRALDAIDDKSDVTQAYNWILEHHKGAADQGGPVTPKLDCPHLKEHVCSEEGFLENLSMDRPCEYYLDVEYGSESKAAASASGGGLKSETAVPSGSSSNAASSSPDPCPSTENWICLQCNATRCSRYVHGHGLAHWEATKHAAPPTDTTDGAGHCVAVSLSDLSVWCHECQSYVSHPSLEGIVQRLQDLKFGTTIALEAK